jgi:hypothetical protein
MYPQGGEGFRVRLFNLSSMESENCALDCDFIIHNNWEVEYVCVEGEMDGDGTFKTP